jgi:hypothetical protein
LDQDLAQGVSVRPVAGRLDRSIGVTGDRFFGWFVGV